MENTLMDAPPVVEKQLNPFERYLTIWVALCMVAGVVLGQVAPSLVQILRTMEFGQGSHINLPMPYHLADDRR
jgi:ACR3 family arsenite transporter